MSDSHRSGTVGIVGLGIMGSAYASRLLANGLRVVGYDPLDDARSRLVESGGVAAGSTATVARACETILLALPSERSLAVATADLALAIQPGTVVCEMGTFSLATKEACRATLEPAGAVVLDAPVSGTGGQAAGGDIAVYASGDEAAFRRVQPVLSALARDVRYCGSFGTGIKLKLVANLLVAIHNLSTAEALLLAERAGLDLQMVLDAIRSGAGTSRMFEVRGPLMISGTYQPATMKMEVFLKDIALIMDFARDVSAPTPLMSAASIFYLAGVAAGRSKQDSGSVFEVLRSMCDQTNVETRDLSVT